MKGSKRPIDMTTTKVLAIAKEAGAKDDDVISAFSNYCDKTTTTPEAHHLINDICMIRPHLHNALVNAWLAQE